MVLQLDQRRPYPGRQTPAKRGKRTPDVVAKWRHRDPQQGSNRNANHFFVPAQEIRDRNYDLSFNRYSDVKHDEAVYEEPKIILHKLKELEDKIQLGIAELESILG